jgi:molybdopterin-synthase adenylyltransferase
MMVPQRRGTGPMDTVVEGKTALVVGAGPIGGAAVLTLASGGVQRIVLVDEAPVQTRDLSGNPLFAEGDVGRRRGEAAVLRLAPRFPGLTVEAPERPFDEASGAGLVAAADVVLDASNLFRTMFLVNDAAIGAGKPLVHAAALLYTAQLFSVVPGETGCLRCLFEAPPPGAAAGASEPDVLGPLAGFAGALMGGEALHLLLDGKATYAGRILVYEARSRRSRIAPLKLRPGCAACSALAASRAASSGGAA